jgi:hypothetical protein
MPVGGLAKCGGGLPLVGLTTATERVDASGQALADTRSVLRVSDACAPRAEGPGRPCAAAPSRPLAAGKRRCRTRSAYVVARTKSGRARGGPRAAMKSTGRRRTERSSRPRADHSRSRQHPMPAPWAAVLALPGRSGRKREHHLRLTQPRPRRRGSLTDAARAGLRSAGTVGTKDGVPRARGVPRTSQLSRTAAASWRARPR